MASRVVPGMSLTMARSSPSSALSSEVLPTFGRPTMATRAGSGESGSGASSVPSPWSPRAASARHRPRHRSPDASASNAAHSAARPTRPPCACARPPTPTRAAAPRRSRRAGRRAPAVQRADRVGLLPAEAVELGGLELALLVVGLVDGHDAPGRVAVRSSSAASSSAGRHRRPAASTTKTMTSASSMASRACSWTFSSIGSPGRRSRPPVSMTTKRRPFHSAACVEAVARRAGAVLDDGRAAADDAVEERALADVGTADEWRRPAAPRAAASRALRPRRPSRRGGQAAQAAPASRVASRYGLGARGRSRCCGRRARRPR